MSASSSHSSFPKVAVIGAGYWGKNLVRNYHELGALHSICDTDAETVAAHLERYPGVQAAKGLGEILEHPEIQGVVIATPVTTHYRLAREALLADKDVYVEKPLCLDAEKGRKLQELAIARGRILMVGHLLWYHPAVVALKKMVDEGALGRIQYIYSNRLNLGKLRREENILWSFAPHDISLILGLINEMPERIQAGGGNFLHQHIADTTVTLLSFASGIRAHIFVSWLHPFKEQKLVVVGERQMAVFDDTAPWEKKLTLYPHTIEWNANIPVANKMEAQYVPVAQGEPLKAECSHFLDCIQSRRMPLTDGAEGLRTLQVLNQCEEALQKSNQSPSIPKVTGSDHFVHETACIDERVKIGPKARIWHFSHILSDTRIGAGCNIGQNCVVGPHVAVGAGCKVQNNVSIYQGVTLEEDVFCGPSMVFTNVMTPRAHVSRKDEYLPTLVKKGATIGANATIVCGHTLGRYSFIGAGAVVIDDVPDHALMVGNPARRIGWMCQCGERLDEGLHCFRCGSHYEEIDGERLQQKG